MSANSQDVDLVNEEAWREEAGTMRDSQHLDDWKEVPSPVNTVYPSLKAQPNPVLPLVLPRAAERQSKKVETQD